MSPIWQANSSPLSYQGSPRGLFYKVTKPRHEGSTHDLSTSQMPSHWGLEFHRINFGRDTNIQFMEEYTPNLKPQNH